MNKDYKDVVNSHLHLGENAHFHLVLKYIDDEILSYIKDIARITNITFSKNSPNMKTLIKSLDFKSSDLLYII